MSREIFIVDLVKNAGDEAKFTVRLAEGTLDDVISIKLVASSFAGVEDSVTAGTPDVPYYVVSFSKEFPAAVEFCDASGRHPYSFPLLLKGAPFHVDNQMAEESRELMVPTQPPGRLGQFELTIARPASVGALRPQGNPGATVARGSDKFPTFTNGFLTFAITRASSRHGAVMVNTTAAASLAHRREDPRLPHYREDMRAALELPHSHPMEGMRRNMRSLLSPQ